MSPFHSSEYFDRIRWAGEPKPDLGTLRAVLQAHVAAIPFENLDVLLGRPVKLDIGSVQEKIVRNRRGGYCFEHATLLAAALESIGFQPRSHSARVVLFSARDQSPRTHMFLTVPLDGATYIVDPGFGPYASAAPLRMPVDGAASSGASSRISRDGNYWVLHVRRGQELVPGWVTTLEEDTAADFQVANHYTATHPASPFRNIIMLSAATPEGRVNVMNRNVTVIRGSEIATSQLQDRTALRLLLLEHFGFDLPEVEQLRVPAIPEW